MSNCPDHNEVTMFKISIYSHLLFPIRRNEDLRLLGSRFLVLIRDLGFPSNPWLLRRRGGPRLRVRRGAHPHVRGGARLLRVRGGARPHVRGGARRGYVRRHVAPTSPSSSLTSPSSSTAPPSSSCTSSPRRNWSIGTSPSSSISTLTCIEKG